MAVHLVTWSKRTLKRNWSVCQCGSENGDGDGVEVCEVRMVGM